MAKTTVNLKVSLARYIQEKQDSTYLVIGRTTPWSNEEAPPEVDDKATTLEEVVGYKKVTALNFVRPFVESTDGSANTISYGNKKWTVVTPENAYKEGAKWLYFESKIVGDELPLGTYRQVGFVNELVPKDGIEKQNLLPSEVQTPGTLLFYDNRQFQNRTEVTTTTERMVIEL